MDAIQLELGTEPRKSVVKLSRDLGEAVAGFAAKYVKGAEPAGGEEGGGG